MLINQTVPENCATPRAAGSARHNVVADDLFDLDCMDDAAYRSEAPEDRPTRPGKAPVGCSPTLKRSLAGERPAGFRTITGMLSRVSHVVGRGMAGEQRCHGAGTVGSLRLSGFLCSIPSPKQGSNSAFVVELLVELPYPGYAGHDRPRHGVGHLPLDG